MHTRGEGGSKKVEILHTYYVHSPILGKYQSFVDLNWFSQVCRKVSKKNPVSDHTLFEQQNSTANKANAAGKIRHEIFGVPGFQHLNWLVPYHSDVPEVYFILMSMALGRVPQSEGWRSAAAACEEETSLATNSIFCKKK